MDALAKMIGIMFMSRTFAHMAHLAITGAGSYAGHKALNEFYDGLVDLADDFAEASQGEYGILDVPYMDLKGDINSPVDGLANHLMMLENLSKKCDDDYLLNIFQEVQKLYRSTMYKLKHLQ